MLSIRAIICLRSMTGAVERVIFQDPNAESKWDLEGGDQNFRASKEQHVAQFFVDLYPSIYFDADTNQRIHELKLVIDGFVVNKTAKFISGSIPCKNINTYYEQFNALGFVAYQQ